MAIMLMASSLFPSLTLDSSRHRRYNRIRWNSVVFASSSSEISCSGVKVTEGSGKLPKVVLSSVDGSEAEVYLFGGCITSWKVPNGKDLLFVRPDAVFDGQKPISGGIPHCFPQFGPGLMQQHGFARNKNWSILDSENVEGGPAITLELKDDPYSRSMWNFSFRSLYMISLTPKGLSTVLTVINTDNKSFSFTTALHSYFHASLTGASVKGLKRCKTLNKDPDPVNPREGQEDRDVITFPGFVDCIYLDAPNGIHVDNGLGDLITISNTNWFSLLKDFICVENAKIGEVQLQPQQSWTAEQDLKVG